jgi:hypothetical protein
MLPGTRILRTIQVQHDHPDQHDEPTIAGAKPDPAGKHR